jgi:nucleoside 2-deoxyribosyltransferase
MSPIKVYIAGPMRSDPDHVEKFNDATTQLRAAGLRVFNPSEECPEPKDKPSTLEFRRRVFALDTMWISLQADILALLPGWEKSKGAVAERALAEAIGIPVRLFNPDTGVLGDAS